MIRLKIDMKNPNAPITGNNGINLFLYSKEAKLIYEVKTIGNIFKTN